jgi:hypothetical protein
VDTAIKACNIARKLTKLWQLSLCRFLALVFYLAISYVENGVYPVSKQSLEQNHGKQASGLSSGPGPLIRLKNANIYDTVLMTVINNLFSGSDIKKRLSAMVL